MRVLYIKKYLVVEEGYKDHNSIERRRLKEGAARNGVAFAIVGLDCSFRNSFRASARG